MRQVVLVQALQPFAFSEHAPAGRQPGDFAGVVQQLRIGDLASQALNVKVLVGPAEQMHINPIAVLRKPAVLRRLEGGPPASVYGTRVQFHPVGIRVKRRHGPLVQDAPSRRADVHHQIAAHGDHVDQNPNQLMRTLPVLLVAVVAPPLGHGESRLEIDRPALSQGRFMRHETLGRVEVGFNIQQIQPVVYNRVRLQLPHEREQPFAVPVIAPLAGHAPMRRPRKAEIREEMADFSVLSQQFRDLGLHESLVARNVALRVVAFKVFDVAQGMKGVDREIPVAPVDQGVVEAHLQALCAAGFDKWTDEVPAVGCVAYVEIGFPGRPEAKAIVVLGGQCHVGHAGAPGAPGPVPGIVEVGIEAVEVLQNVLVGQFLPAPVPGALRMKRVEAEMNDHSETVMNKPVLPLGIRLL